MMRRQSRGWPDARREGSSDSAWHLPLAERLNLHLVVIHRLRADVVVEVDVVPILTIGILDELVGTCAGIRTIGIGARLGAVEVVVDVDVGRYVAGKVGISGIIRVEDGATTVGILLGDCVERGGDRVDRIGDNVGM